MKRFILLYILPPIIALLIKCVYLFSKKNLSGHKDFIKTCGSGAVIVAVFHGDLIPVIGFFNRHIVKNVKVDVLVSPTNDGKMLGRVIKLLGGNYKTGDHRKKPVAGLIKMIKTVRDEKGLPVFAVDGPLGPVFTVRAGAMQCANKCNAPVVAITASAKKAIRPKSSWDKLFIPLPLTKTYINFSEKIMPSGDVEKDTEKLKKVMLELKQKCNEKAGLV